MAAAGGLGTAVSAMHPLVPGGAVSSRLLSGAGRGRLMPHAGGNAASPRRVQPKRRFSEARAGKIIFMTGPRGAAVLALHWQVNVIKPEGFFGGMLGEPVARSGVVGRAVQFHEAARSAGAAPGVYPVRRA